MKDDNLCSSHNAHGARRNAGSEFLGFSQSEILAQTAAEAGGVDERHAVCRCEHRRRVRRLDGIEVVRQFKTTNSEKQPIYFVFAGTFEKQNFDNDSSDRSAPELLTRPSRSQTESGESLSVRTDIAVPLR